ncbi:hypothetical protein PQC11_gp178 [Synechococcus phage S-H9-1]|uniref:Uncharacterized protein n=1 Tax=Synechococcus phage S-H9-1 TaxID=2783674 RepID=A0A873WAJ6_9CAUD|nr:hypothetical protein PQC11_gp178 [Synechococcus phage S-H9-1]QPB08150.1 hypothetical protein [Synechococcus phage S-H9-1]
MEIKPIKIRGNEIPEVTIFDNSIPQVFTGYPIPVTVDIGMPVVDMPGCVETRETDDLREVDPRGNMTFCDGQVPSYNPPNFEPNQTLPTQRPKVDTRQPKAPEAPDLPIPKTPPATAKVDCPTPAQQAKEPVGTYIEGFRKKVTDYQLVGNQCIQITEPVPLPEQIVAGLPAAGTVVTTSSIAVVATASALMAKPLADILLKVIKPTVKKVMKKIAAIRGKSVPVLSVRDRQDLQRERTQAIRALRSVLKPKG